METEFLGDLFLDEGDCVDPTGVWGSVTSSCDSSGHNRTKYQYYDNNSMIAVDDDPLSDLFSWEERIFSSVVDPTMSDEWSLGTTVDVNPMLTSFDNNQQVPFLLHSGREPTPRLFDSPEIHERQIPFQNDESFLNSSSTLRAEGTPLDWLKSFYTDSPPDENFSYRVIHTPTSSKASDNSNSCPTEPDFSQHLWSKFHSEPEGIEHALGSGQQSNEIHRNRFTVSDPTESMSTYNTERLDVASTVFGPHPCLPPPQQLMTTFESKDPKLAVIKGKKAYTIERKKKVAKVRKVGACWQCQVRKIACSADETCSRCQMMASNPKLAGQICLRQRLMDIYLSHSSIYEMIIKSQERNNRAVKLVPDTVEQLSFRLEAMTDDCPTLTLTVTPYKRIYPGSALSGSYTKPLPWHPPATECRAILPDSIPSIEQLENMTRTGTCKVHDPFLSHELHDKIDLILLVCSRRQPPQPLHELVTATLRLVNLRSFLMHSLVYTCGDEWGGTSQNSYYADPVLNQHIRAIALAGIARAENFVISQFNDLTRLVAFDSHRMMIAKICLLRLLLVYRNDVLLCTRSAKIPVKSRVVFVTRLEKVKFMYRVAVTTYCTLCERTSSFTPLEWFDHAQQNDSISSGDASILAVATSELDTAYKNFCQQELSEEHDQVLLLFIKRSMRKKTKKALE